MPTLRIAEEKHVLNFFTVFKSSDKNLTGVFEIRLSEHCDFYCKTSSKRDAIQRKFRTELCSRMFCVLLCLY